MSKIGFIISRVYQGAGIQHTSEFAKQYEGIINDDVRNYLKCVEVDGLSADKLLSSFYDFLVFGKDVAFIYTNKYISGRGEDLISGIIVIPGIVDISGKEIEELLKKMKDHLGKIKRDDFSFEKEFFSKDYGERKILNSSIPSLPENEGRYAFRFYGKGTQYTLSEVLDDLFQSYYSEYVAVFLVDKESGLVLREGLDDLTNREFIKRVVLHYPHNLPKDVSLSVNGEPFIKDCIFGEGQRITLVANRDHYWPINNSFILNSQNNNIDLSIFDWELKVEKSWFDVVDIITDEKIRNPEIKINNKPVDGYNRFKNRDLQHSHLKVSAFGYSDYNENDFSMSHNKPIKIQLSREPLKFEIEDSSILVDGSRVTLVIENPSLDINESHIKGYVVSKGKLRYQPLSINKRKKKWIYLFGIIFCFLALWGGVSICNTAYKEIKPIYNEFKQKIYALLGWQEGPAQPEGGSDYDDGETPNEGNTEDSDGSAKSEELDNNAITYLKNNKKWERGKMGHKHAEDLYDDINYYRFDKIRNYWDSILKNKDIPYWNQLIKAIGDKQNKDIQNKDEVFSKKETINIIEYINEIKGETKGVSKPTDDKKTKSDSSDQLSPNNKPNGIGGFEE